MAHPVIVVGTYDNRHRAELDYEQEVVIRRDISPSGKSRAFINDTPTTLKVLRQGLREVVTNGTATMLNDPRLPAVAGKTGTAEDPPRPDHAWFGGYAPAGKPDLVIIAFGENSGGYGGTIAVPMVKALLATWFNPAQAAS